jgi:hypothetical protein
MRLGPMLVRRPRTIRAEAADARAAVAQEAAEARAVAAQEAAARAEDRQRAAIRINALREISDRVHEIGRAFAETMAGEIWGVDRADRHRARLRALLDGAPIGGVSLPYCEAVAAGEPPFLEAMAEAEAAIALEMRHMAE